DDANVDLAVAIEVDATDVSRLGVDRAQWADVTETGAAGDSANVLAAPADEFALRIVGHDLEAGLEAHHLTGPLVEQILIVLHCRHDHFAAFDDRLHPWNQSL